MAGPSLDDLKAFAAVARAGGFTRAAALLGTSQPALSRTVRGLEARMGVRLLNRTTRSVVPTAAGAVLLADLTPALDAIGGAVARAQATDATPHGTVRITADRHGHDMILAPALPGFLAAHPGVSVEVRLSDAFVDAVGEGFDAGLRLGDLVERDMIAAKVGPEVTAAIVASPGYLTHAGAPRTPRDLSAHLCIGYRQPRTGGLYAWGFEKAGRRQSVRVEGRLVLDDGAAILRAVLDGMGLAYLFHDQVAAYLADGRLVRVLADWCPPMPGFRLYYPERRHQPACLAALVDYLMTHAATE